MSKGWAHYFWDREALRTHTVRAVLQMLGIDPARFEEAYRAECKRVRSLASLRSRRGEDDEAVAS